MFDHFQHVVEANRRFNLTRIADPALAAVKHYVDSLSLLAMPGIDPASPMDVLDVGTGAGYPAIPLAIMCPNWRIKAIDATGKKVRFVAETVQKLGLNNVDAGHIRAADLARQSSDTFDLVVLRAVSKLADGLREVHPLIRSGGMAVFYKTAHIEKQEISNGLKVARSVGLQGLEPIYITLPSREGPIKRSFWRYERPY